MLVHADYQPPFIQPTVAANITTDMLLAQDGTFGPVVAISRFNNISEAIDRANNSPYGLSALVFGGADIAQQMEALARGLVPNKVDLAFMEACGSPTVFPGKSIQ